MANLNTGVRYNHPVDGEVWHLSTLTPHLDHAAEDCPTVFASCFDVLKARDERTKRLDWWAWLIAAGAFAVFAYFGWGLLT